jgi:hypothetical protein
MAYQTFSVSQKDMDEYYIPLSNDFNKMIGSINANGYGQLIYNYNGPGDFTLNSYNVWNSGYGSMVVITADESVTYTESQAGPALWGVSSEVGIQFLQGLSSIEGLARIKYCNSCSDRNGLPLSTIISFTDRFRYLKELKNDFTTKVGYIFYDYSLPVNQRWYPSVYDSGLGRYVFKNYLGVNKLEAQVSSETSIPLQDITASIDNSKPILPPKTFNYLLRWCCDPNITTVIELPYELSSKVVSFKDQSGARPPCWTASPTTDGAREIVESVIEYEFCADCYRIHGLCRR